MTEESPAIARAGDKPICRVRDTTTAGALERRRFTEIALTFGAIFAVLFRKRRDYTGRTASERWKILAVSR